MAIQYIIDGSKPFEGFTIHITDANGMIQERDDLLTLEEYKKVTDNPNLIAITEEELDRKHAELRNSYLEKEFEEISETKYNFNMNVLPPAKMGWYVLFDYFFISTCYSYDLYPFCFRCNDRYFTGLRSIRTDLEKLREEIYDFLRKNDLLSDGFKDFIHEPRDIVRTLFIPPQV